jgi:prepilin-type N-terminal cleavage/methylation domain-containing protein
MKLSVETRKQGGFSLVEVMIVTSVFVVVLSAIFGVMGAGLDTYRSGDSLVEVQNQARRIIDQIAKEVQAAGLSTISPTPPPSGQEGTHTITFQPCTGYSGGAIQWGNVTTIAFEYDPDEENNDEDDNGDGLIDEGLITRTEIVGESTQSARLGIWVKENGLSFNLDGPLLTIKIEMEKRGAKGEIMETSLTTSVLIKND